MKKAVQLEFGDPRPGDPDYKPPQDWARPGLVDAAMVERSVAAMRDMPDAERQLREGMAQSLQGIRDIDLVYGAEPNEWATDIRERLWLELFTAEAILRRLTSEKNKCVGNSPRPHSPGRPWN